MNDLATILLPTYNGAKYVLQMLESIYLQDYRPIEVIISDDASTDKTLLVIEHWLKDKIMENISFKVIKNIDNVGLSGNVSRAAKYVHGKYLFLADQDDLWHSNKVSSQIEYLEEHNECVVCICDRSIINKENEIVCESYFKYVNAFPEKRDYRTVLNCGRLYAANCMCLRTEHLNKIFPIPRQVCEHDTFIIIMAAHFGEIGYIIKALTLYRIYENNLSGQFAMEINRNPFKAGFVIYKAKKRMNRRESVDPFIIKKVLEQRFNETGVEFSRTLYPGTVNHIYWQTIKYMIDNKERWKLFCK